uniref:Protein kinase domain-containing protein n=1 Tax=Gouania willdenowi TaxID=441366 RepID=A0A8C5DL20_GOUWI
KKDEYYNSRGSIMEFSYNAFTILEFIGEGAFGKVAKCQVNGSNAIVAVKILKQEIEEDVEHELGMLEAIGQLNADQVHVIKLYEIFQHCGHTCLVFEMLDIDLFQHCLNKNSLYVNAIRPIAKQLLETLQALQYLKIVHTDIKPDNVMLINMKYLPYRVKLIDFGKALHYYTSKLGGMHQAVGYRAPEVTLGLPFTESIDMWGLGCLLAFLYLGFHLFPVHCEHLMLLTKKEYSIIHKKNAQNWPRNQTHFTSLDDLVYVYEKMGCAEMKDRKAFIDLLKKMLRLDGAKRISPTEALQHPFITMSHLSHDPRSRDYLTEAQAGHFPRELIGQEAGLLYLLKSYPEQNLLPTRLVVQPKLPQDLAR